MKTLLAVLLLSLSLMGCKTQSTLRTPISVPPSSTEKCPVMPDLNNSPDALATWAAKMVVQYPECALRHAELVDAVREHNDG